jgi:carboxyl-terminal processing protease
MARARALTVAALTVSGAVAVAASPAAPYAHFDTYARVVAQIRSAHVNAHDEGGLIYASLAGLARSLDPYSAFYPPEQAAMLRAAAQAPHTLGLEVVPHAHGLRVERSAADGPAGRAGIREGDVIVAVDGARPPSLEDVDRVESRSSVTVLRVLRDGDARDVTVVLSAARPGVRLRMVDGVHVLEIDDFAPGVARAATRALREAAAADAPVVIDLRDNPGGRPDEAATLVDAFVRHGRIYRTVGRVVGTMEERDATDEPSDLDGPLAILVDANTASAAEIVAGALQDLGRAVVIGERTYGKGTVQTAYGFEDGSVLNLTIAQWELPSGRVLAPGRGIVPNVTVEPSPAQRATELLRSVERLPLDEETRTRLTTEARALASSQPADTTDRTLSAALNWARAPTR